MITAPQLLAVLQERHKDALFVPECKNGPSQTGSHRRLDAWVLLKSWSLVTTIGYEIKVDRGDWRRDEKIPDYMGMCHELYLVAPKGLIPVDELPNGVGLMEGVGFSPIRLVVRKKPERREIQIPMSLLLYVLICRTKIKGEREDIRAATERWKFDSLVEWARSKDERQALHFELSKKIRDRFDALQVETRELRNRVHTLEKVEARIRELGFDPDTPIHEWDVRRRVDQVAGVITPALLRQLDETERWIGRVREGLEGLRAGAAGVAS